MLEAIIKRLKHDKHGVSNVIVIMLSLILIVVIVANVVLWSYQMNQFDWEKMQESVRISSVTKVNRSSWFGVENEYKINVGNIVNGTYQDTKTADGVYEAFQEEKFQLETLRPNAVGQHAEWPREYPGGNAHWSLVGEDSSDDDATYVENDAEAWKKESYNLQESIGSGTINWIRVYIRAKVPASGSSIIRTLIRTYGTDYEGSDLALSTSYRNNYTQYNVNSNTGSAWTWTELASLEAGASSKKSGADNVRLTAVWVVVNYTNTNYSFDMTGTFTLDLSTYPLDYIEGVEIQLRYRASDTGENWFLKAYNWTTMAYSDSAFNNTLGHTPTTSWDIYAVNLTDKWRSYVSDGGTIYVKMQDNQPDVNQTTINIDFLAVRVVINGTKITFQNKGSLTSHLVSLWVDNSTQHQRYDINIFINSGDTESYIRNDISLSDNPYTVRVVTERGNIAVFTSH